MRIQTNTSALKAKNNFTKINGELGKALEKLSSGYCINRAADNAAGLAVSEKMRAQITCLSQAESNCNDGISLLQTAEGALAEVHDSLNRMVELATQSANGVYDNEVDRVNLQAEIEQLQSEIDRISEATNFNGINLLDGTMVNGGKINGVKWTVDGVLSKGDYITGIKVDENGIPSFGSDISVKIGNKVYGNLSNPKYLSVMRSQDKKSINFEAGYNAPSEFKEMFGKGFNIYFDCKNQTNSINPSEKFVILGGELSLQIGDTDDDFNKLNIIIESMSCEGLEIDKVRIDTINDSSKAIDAIKTAINKVSETRGYLGANQNRLEHTINNLSVTNENTTTAESRIRDTDMAKYMSTYTAKNVISQAAQSLLAQANTRPEMVLQMLG